MESRWNVLRVLSPRPNERAPSLDEARGSTRLERSGKVKGHPCHVEPTFQPKNENENENERERGREDLTSARLREGERSEAMGETNEQTKERKKWYFAQALPA